MRRTITSSLLSFLLLVSISPILRAQGEVSYSYNNAGDLTHRSAAGSGEQKGGQSTVLPDSLLTEEQIFARLGIRQESDSANKQVYTPSPYFNRDSILIRRNALGFFMLILYTMLD